MIFNSTILFNKLKKKKLMMIPEGINRMMIPEGINSDNSVQECEHSNITIDEQPEAMEIKKLVENIQTKNESNRINKYINKHTK